MAEEGTWASLGRLAVAAMVALGVSMVDWPAMQVFSQEVSNSDREKGTKPKPVPDTEKSAKSDEPAVVPTWLQAQDMSGSSDESEKAVGLALAWLAEHQFAAGGWSFDHRLGPCQGRCSNPGQAMAKAVNGATGMALLPFIDHGSTHQTGPYRQNVAAGLQFLMARMDKNGSLWEPGGQMYSHALGLLALCEDLRVDGEVSGHSADLSSLLFSAATGKKGRAARGDPYAARTRTPRPAVKLFSSKRSSNSGNC